VGCAVSRLRLARFRHCTRRDEAVRALVLARIIEPTSKLDSLRVLDEAGVAAPSYRTVTRRLPSYGKPLWREDISAACAAQAALGPASLVLYDVYFETDQGDETREKSRPFQAQSLRMTVAGPHEATGKSAEQSIVSSRPPTNANP
jgi:hypothetical protein